jgi:hypothetical protein
VADGPADVSVDALRNTRIRNSVIDAGITGASGEGRTGMATRARRWLVTGAVAWVGISAALVTANAPKVYRDATAITTSSVSDDPRFVVLDADSAGALVVDRKDSRYQAVDPLGRTTWSDRSRFSDGAYGSCLADCSGVVLSSSTNRWSDLRQPDVVPMSYRLRHRAVSWSYSQAWKTRVLAADNESDALLLQADSRGRAWLEIRTPTRPPQVTAGTSSSASPTAAHPTGVSTASSTSTPSAGDRGSTGASSPAPSPSRPDDGNEPPPSYTAARISLPTAALTWSTDVGRTTGILAEDLPMASATRIWTFGRTVAGWTYLGTRPVPYPVVGSCVGPSDLAVQTMLARRSVTPAPQGSTATKPGAAAGPSSEAAPTGSISTGTPSPVSTATPPVTPSAGSAARRPAGPAVPHRNAYLVTSGMSASANRVVLETAGPRGWVASVMKLDGRATLGRVDQCAVLSGGLVLIQRMQDGKGKNQTKVRVIDDRGRTKWSTDLRGTVTVSAAPDGRDVLVDTPDGVMKVSATGSVTPLGTAYDYAVYGRNGALVQLADDGDILIQ